MTRKEGVNGYCTAALASIEAGQATRSHFEEVLIWVLEAVRVGAGPKAVAEAEDIYRTLSRCSPQQEIDAGRLAAYRATLAAVVRSPSLGAIRDARFMTRRLLTKRQTRAAGERGLGPMAQVVFADHEAATIGRALAPAILRLEHSFLEELECWIVDASNRLPGDDAGFSRGLLLGFHDLVEETQDYDLPMFEPGSVEVATLRWLSIRGRVRLSELMPLAGEALLDFVSAHLRTLLDGVLWDELLVSSFVHSGGRETIYEITPYGRMALEAVEPQPMTAESAA
jgi:hypothetical protein